MVLFFFLQKTIFCLRNVNIENNWTFIIIPFIWYKLSIDKKKKKKWDTLLCIFDEPAGHRRAVLSRPAKRLVASFHRMIFTGCSRVYNIGFRLLWQLWSILMRKRKCRPTMLCVIHCCREIDGGFWKKRKEGGGKTISGHFSEINLISLLFGGPLWKRNCNEHIQNRRIDLPSASKKPALSASVIRSFPFSSR